MALASDLDRRAARLQYHREYFRRRYQEDAEFRARSLVRSKRYKDSHRERGAQRQRDLRDRHGSLIATYKLERGCADCGYNAHPMALDFDHRDPAIKDRNVTQLINAATERLVEEIEKCDVRCANCHRVRTHGGPLT